MWKRGIVIHHSPTHDRRLKHPPGNVIIIMLSLAEENEEKTETF